MQVIDGHKNRLSSAFADCALALALASSSIAYAGDPPEQSFTVTAASTAAWTIDGMSNRTLTVMRGKLYRFALQNVNGIHPFYIKTLNSTGSDNVYSDGVTGNGSTGTTNIDFQVPASAPASLHYNCFNHPGMNGVINVIDDPELIFKNGFE